MPTLDLHLEGDACWPDLIGKQDQIIHMTEGLSIAALSDGMLSGGPSVALRIDLPNGQVVIAETSMRLFLTVADAMRRKYYRQQSQEK